MLIKRNKLFNGLFLAIFSLLLIFLASVPTVSAFNCPRDPDYEGAGTYNVPNQIECQNRPDYDFGGNNTSPTIEYRRDDASTTVFINFTLEAGSSTPDTYVWRAVAPYDNHNMAISIKKSDVTSSDGRDVKATRVDILLPSEIRIDINDKFRAFMDSKNVNVPEAPASNQSGSEANNLGNFGVAIDSGGAPGKYQCGKGTKAVKTGFNFGCRGVNYGGAELNPIVDIAFSIFRFLSVGVGLVVIGSVIVAGIQYSLARDNPQMTSAALKRILNSAAALLMYIFMYALANFLIPGGLF
jgi:hypothetical protein